VFTPVHLPGLVFFSSIRGPDCNRRRPSFISSRHRRRKEERRQRIEELKNGYRRRASDRRILSSGRIDQGLRTLWLRQQVRLIGVQIDRYRDMLMHNQPISFDLTVYVRDPHREIDRLILGLGALDVLNGMAIA
jgi:hypothetical protein